jgi:hypothetical protein
LDITNRRFLWKQYQNQRRRPRHSANVYYYTFLKYLTQLIKIKELQKPSVIEVELAVLKKEVKNMNSNPFGVKVWLLDQIGLGRE